MSYFDKKTKPSLNRSGVKRKALSDRAGLSLWLAGQRASPADGAPPSLGKAIMPIIRPLSRRFQTSHSVGSLKTQWPHIVGARWARVSRPEKITCNKTAQRRLYIQAPVAAGALIIADAGNIINRVNGFLGRDYIQDIQVRYVSDVWPELRQNKPAQGEGLRPGQEKTLRDGLVNIDNEPLHQAMMELGRAVLSRQDKQS